MTHMHILEVFAGDDLSVFFSVCKTQYALVVKINILVNGGWDAGG